MSHLPKPKAVGPVGARRLICQVRGCGEPVIGAFRSYHAWVGGVHLSDFEAGRYEVRNYMDRWGPGVNWSPDS